MSLFSVSGRIIFYCVFLLGEKNDVCDKKTHRASKLNLCLFYLITNASFCIFVSIISLYITIMTPQNITLLKEDIIALLHSNKDLSLLNKIKSLLSFESESLEVSETEVPYITMTEEEIVKQAKLADEEIKQGKTIPHEQAYREFKKW